MLDRGPTAGKRQCLGKRYHEENTKYKVQNTKYKIENRKGRLAVESVNEQVNLLNSSRLSAQVMTKNQIENSSAQQTRQRNYIIKTKVNFINPC